MSPGEISGSLVGASSSAFSCPSLASIATSVVSARWRSGFNLSKYLLQLHCPNKGFEPENFRCPKTSSKLTPTGKTHFCGSVFADKHREMCRRVAHHSPFLLFFSTSSECGRFRVFPYNQQPGLGTFEFNRRSNGRCSGHNFTWQEH